MSKVPELVVPTHLKIKLTQGHPWVYRSHLPDAPSLASGTWVRVRSGGFSAYGLWDARSPIAVRLFARDRAPNRAWLAARVQAAWQRRAPLRDTDTTAYRWLFGEGDGVPGVTVDLYGDFAVVATYADAVQVLVPWVVDALREIAPLKGILLRQRRGDFGPADGGDHDAAARGGVQRLWGAPPPRDLTIRENGLTFLANLSHGQKTGLFLDQRDNRRTLEGWCAGKMVLNCFAYTGGFSMYAARGGAVHVTSVDIAADAIGDAQLNFERNGLDPRDHSFAVADVFEYLTRARDAGRAFDVVILDPPSFARAKSSQHAALRAYARLNALGMQVTRPGGLLATASCTSQVSPDAFRDALAQAGASVDRRLLILHEVGQPLDHPVPAHFPEGRYLKFVMGEVVREA